MSRLEGISGKPKSRSRRLHYSAEKLQIGPKISLSRFPKTSLVSNDSGVFSPRRDLRFAPPSQNVFLRFIVSRADAAGLPCCHTSQPSRGIDFQLWKLNFRITEPTTTTKYEFLSPLNIFFAIRTTVDVGSMRRETSFFYSLQASF